MTEVAAALIRRKDTDGDGKEGFLICRRPPHKARGGLWEFVGGKLEPGETGEQALVRECREELGVEVEPTSVFTRIVHEYPDLTVALTVYRAVIVSGEPELLEHTEMRWITPDMILQFNFCPADEEILRLIRERQGSDDDA